MSRIVEYLPRQVMRLDTPIVVLQSDDWGLVGVRDGEGAEELRRQGFEPGRSPYGGYSLETAEDLRALYGVLERHRDASGRAACMVFNFVMANVDFGRALERGLDTDTLIPLGDGLPAGWERPGLLEAYHEGIGRGLVYPALHGLTHFNLRAAQGLLKGNSPAGERLRALYRSGTPQLEELRGVLGFEYLTPGEGWLDLEEQGRLIGLGARLFEGMFGTGARSACAPGYRANGWTHKAWKDHGIAAVQNGPAAKSLPHKDRNGLWMLYRMVELEPAAHGDWSEEKAHSDAEEAVRRGAPVIVSVHSINFHSTVGKYREGTLEKLDRLLGYLERRFPNLRYGHDGDLIELFDAAEKGAREGRRETGVRRSWELPQTVRNYFGEWR